jgi:hypothetical protein
MGAFIVQKDLENALSPAVVLALFDDQSVGTASATAIAEVIDSAEAEVRSYLVNPFGTPLPAAAFTDPLLRLACIDFAIVFAYERHPEYVRSQGETGKLESRWKRAKERMERIQAAMQRPATLDPSTKPSNVGGQVRSGDPKSPTPPAKSFANGTGDF